MLSIQTLGALQVQFNGATLPLPASRKTRALLGYLALSAAPQRRDRLCELLWEVPDDPRGALRWSLSKLRPVLNAGNQLRLLADRERVRLDTDTIEVDSHQLRDCADDENASLEEMQRAWEKAAEPLLEDCELPNHPDFSAWLKHQRDGFTRLRVRLARRLALAPGLPAEETERWAQRWMVDAPFNAHAAQRVVMAKRRLGRERDANALAHHLTLEFRNAGLTPPTFTEQAPALATASTLDDTIETSIPQQKIRFVRTGDETALAWASVGSANNPPLVKAANWLSHLELDWEAPIWSPLFKSLARTFNFVRYDERGCGLSNWDVSEINFETFVSDLEMVVDAAGLERFPLLGISQGASVSIEYAARHPERVSHLILFGGYPAGWRHTASADEAREREAVMVLTEAGWGRDNPSYRQLFSQTFMPEAQPDELRWFNEFQRRTTSPENAVRFLEAFSRIDVRDRLKDVKAPTLVLHSRGDLRIPVAVGHDLATQIPNAQFIGLDSNNHLLLGREPASLEFIQAVRDFITRS
jgi:pimeloyl-ACP methyl ester carboxylesterase/DNA-binding SARP family transcriptional activator